MNLNVSPEVSSARPPWRGLPKPTTSNHKITPEDTRRPQAMSSTKVSISFASVPYDRMQALQSGEIKAEGIDLNFLSVNHPRDIFDRMSGGKEFDASELSLSE